MVEREPGAQVALQTGIYQPVVVVEAPPIHSPGALGQYPRPSGGKTKITEPHPASQVQVGFVAVIEIGGHAPVLIAPDGPLAARKIVPYTRAFALVLPRAFGLISSGGSAPVKIRPEIGPGNWQRARSREEGGGERLVVGSRQFNHARGAVLLMGNNRTFSTSCFPALSLTC